MIVLLLASACSRTNQDPTPVPVKETSLFFSKDELKSWYAGKGPALHDPKNTDGNKSVHPWRMPLLSLDRAEKVNYRKSNWWILSLPGRPTFRGLAQGYRKIAFFKDPATGTIRFNVLEIIPDALYIQRKQRARTNDFSGRVFIFDEHYQLQGGLLYQNGKPTGKIRPIDSTNIQVNGLHTDNETIIRDCEWHDANYVDANQGVVIYSELQCSYMVIDDGEGAAAPISGSSGSDYLGGGGGGGGTAADSPAPSNLPGEGGNKIDPKRYMDCFGDLPDAGAKMTVTVYVQLPWPGTTFNYGPNSVGHTCIGLTKTNGTTTITQTVGFYPDATGLSKMHAPSKLLDNTALDYNQSIRYSVNAAQFNNILNYIANPPATYDLTDFNCTNFVYVACQRGDITLPNPLDHIGSSDADGGKTAMTPAALGNSIDGLKNSNVNHAGGKVPISKGPCN